MTHDGATVVAAPHDRQGLQPGKAALQGLAGREGGREGAELLAGDSLGARVQALHGIEVGGRRRQVVVDPGGRLVDGAGEQLLVGLVRGVPAGAGGHGRGHEARDEDEPAQQQEAQA